VRPLLEWTTHFGGDAANGGDARGR